MSFQKPRGAELAETIVTDVVAFLVSQLQNEGLQPERIILFGSQADNTASKNSDIDLAIIASAFRDQDLTQRAMMTRQAEILTIRAFMIPLDIITLTPEELEDGTSLLSAYIRRGRTVFAA